MTLKYCPNCRHELDGVILGWICLRTFRAKMARHAADAEQVEKDRAAMFAGVDSNGSNEPFEGIAEALAAQTVCNHYNEPGTEVCGSADCVAATKGARQPKESCNACPACKSELPALEGLLGHTITIAGPSGAGKSHYIVALNDWWESRLPTLGLVATSAMGKARDRLFSAFRNHVLEKRETLPATRKDIVISFSWQIYDPTNPDAKSLLCTVPDVAGEDLLSERALRANQHYRYSTGIIILLDGMRIANSLGLCDYQRKAKDHVTMLDAMIKYLRHEHGKADYRKIPVAVCVNKLDALASLDPHRQWQHVIDGYTPEHSGGFDHETCEARSQYIEQLLHGHRDTEVIARQVSLSFDNVMFFALSTIGSETAEQYQPQFVEDPFLWMLWHMCMVQ